MSDNNMAAKISKLRQEKNLTLEEMAQKVGVSKSTVLKWESGSISNMRRDKIAKIAKALNVSPVYLMGWDENQNDLDDQSAPPDYYYNKEVRELADFLHKNPDYKVLFDASRKVKPEDIEFVKTMIERMGGNDGTD